MAKRGVKGIRAAWQDAAEEFASEKEQPDPSPSEPRTFDVGGKREEFRAGDWPGAPVNQLPPGCPVVPLGVDGQLSYFIDTLGQVLAFDGLDKKRLIKLFRSMPNALYFYWPRWSEPKAGRPSVVNGLEVDDAIQCLEKSAASRGLFSAIDNVRGRGAWTDTYGSLIWHAGDRLYTIDKNRKLKASSPGEIDGLFYPRRPTIMAPYREPVTPAESPAQEIFKDLQTWSWHRPALDPIIMIGWIGVGFIGGALEWRPHVFASGDMKVGKTELNRLLKGALHSVLHDTGNTSEAGVRQRLGLDTLPVAVDEMEASEDNRRVVAIIELARLASSGARLYRGGQDHKGIEFQARSAFFCSGIIPPPMKPQDRSRFAFVNLNKLKAVGTPPKIADDAGRMILRSLMDGWHDFPRALADWKSVLRSSGLDGRQQDTYGTLFAIAELMLGQDTLEEAGLPVTEGQRLGELIAQATAGERAEQIENWRACLEHMLGAPIDNWKGGDKPSVGAVIERLEANELELTPARDRLQAAGLGLIEEAPAAGGFGKRRYVIAVPPAAQSPALAKLFEPTRWRDGGWKISLEQGRDAGVVRTDTKVVKINRVACRCTLVDLAAYDKLMEDRK